MNKINSIKSDVKTIKELLKIGNNKIVFPIYQRKYDWPEPNVLTLINDINNNINFSSYYYFGNISIKRAFDDTDTNSLPIYKIIDGQQRITTSWLIICATRDLFIEKHQKTIDQIQWYLDITQNNKVSDYIDNTSDQCNINILFSQILNGKIDDELDKQKENNKYYLNYKIIKDNLQEYSVEQLQKFISTFLDKFCVVELSFDDKVYSNKKEMEIFDNLNSKGLGLNVVDLMKNHILYHCDDNVLSNKQNEKEIIAKYSDIENLYKDQLEDFYSIIKEIYSGKEIQGQENQIRFSNIKPEVDKFFIDYNEINSVNKFRNMMDYFKKYLSILKESISHNSFDFINKIKCNHLFSIVPDHKKKRLLFYFLFLVFRYLEINQISINQLDKKQIRYIQDMFVEIVKFIARTTIISQQGDSGIKRHIIATANKIFIQLQDINLEELCQKSINEIKEINKQHYRLDEFKVNLKQLKTHTQASTLLGLVEFYMSNNLHNNGETINRETFSIEHILPQNPNEWINEIDDLEYKNKLKENSKNYENKIGNFLILTKHNNSKAKNYVFTRKKSDVYNDLISKLYQNDNLDIDVSRKQKWTFEDIDKRTEALIEYILKNVFIE